MKRITGTFTVICVFFIGLLSCALPPEAGLRITTSGVEPIPFSGFYQSNQIERIEVDGVTMASYKVKVNTSDDFLRAGFVKIDPADSFSELRVQLYYRGLRDKVVVTSPGDTAFIDFLIKK